MKILRFIIIFIAFTLSGCVAAVVAGAAAGAVVYDGRGAVIIARDANIDYLINNAIAKDRRFNHSRIVVVSFGQAVLLVGQTQAATLRVLASKIAEKTPYVARVYNEINIKAPISLTTRAKDTWITGEVRGQMLMRKGLESGSIRVVTEDGIVYLMGVVSREQAYHAVDVARQVRGVNRVIKVFKYT